MRRCSVAGGTMPNDLGLCGNPVEDGKEGLWKPEGTRTP